MREGDIDYNFSLYKSEYMGYWTRPNGRGHINMYVGTIWDTLADDRKTEERFLAVLTHTMLLETVCMIRSGQKIRMKNRCEPCKLYKTTDFMLYPDEWPSVREHYKVEDYESRVEFDRHSRPVAADKGC